MLPVMFKIDRHIMAFARNRAGNRFGDVAVSVPV
jgi:hypothetical protein